MRGSRRPNITARFWLPLLWPSALCLSRSLDAQLEAQRPTLPGDGFLYCILSAISLDPNSSEPQSPFGLMWLSLPHLVYNSVRSLTGTGTVLTSVLTELYNSSTPTQSPTRSLKSHVWSSSSGNNCHAVHRSLSSGASVYECTMGIFLHCPVSSANFRPRDFLSELPLECVASFRCITLEWHFWPGRRSKYNVTWYTYKRSLSQLQKHTAFRLTNFNLVNIQRSLFLKTCSV